MVPCSITWRELLAEPRSRSAATVVGNLSKCQKRTKPKGKEPSADAKDEDLQIPIHDRLGENPAERRWWWGADGELFGLRPILILRIQELAFPRDQRVLWSPGAVGNLSLTQSDRPDLISINPSTLCKAEQRQRQREGRHQSSFNREVRLRECLRRLPVDLPVGCTGILTAGNFL